MDIFSERRQALLDSFKENSIAILFGSEEMIRNGDVNFPFRQNSNFSYLTNFPESQSIAILKKNDFFIFCKEKNKLKEQWDGEIIGPGNVKRFGATKGMALKDFQTNLLEITKDISNIYCFDSSISKLKRILPDYENDFLSLDLEVSKMRSIKSNEELELIKKACNISSLAHMRAMRSVQPGMYEYQLEAEYVHEFMKKGARNCAYPSIVGGGKNACILHYNDNRDLLMDGDLVLVDAGCEFNGYASDITRTFPVNGKFSKAQQAIYEIVLEANIECIKTVKKGLTPNETEKKAIKVITQGLVDLKILNGEINELIENGAYRDFYMHRVGHWMGMDVHDVGSYGKNGNWRKYLPGMITTIEPGIYFKEDLKNAPKEYLNIGIRIEDDVLVTEGDPEVLTSSVPKTIKDIEKLMSS